MYSRYVSMIVISAVLISVPYIIPAMMPRGVILALCMCGVTITINRLNAVRLDNDQPPTWRSIVSISLIGGLCAGAGASLYTYLLSSGHWPSTSMPEVLFWPPPHAALMLALVYCAGTTCAYHLRWYIGYAALIPMVAAGTLGGLLRLTGVPQPLEMDMLYYSAITGAGFAVAWTLVVLMFDPAFSFKRWHRYDFRVRFMSAHGGVRPHNVITKG